MKMTVDEKLALLEEILDVDEGELKPEMELDDIEEWDSIGKLSLMAEVRKRSGVVIAVSDINKCQTVQDVIVFLE
ncbi:MAG: acyl carrier protein [Lachnospiraceae bacterium]|nr:acyl carrier protein [Lachnospiraceae bacterium]